MVIAKAHLKRWVIAIGKTVKEFVIVEMGIAYKFQLVGPILVCFEYFQNMTAVFNSPRKQINLLAPSPLKILSSPFYGWAFEFFSGDGVLVTNKFLSSQKVFATPGAPILCTHIYTSPTLGNRTHKSLSLLV